MSNRVSDITGVRFGSLTALGNTGLKKSGNYIWTFKCDCGLQCEFPSSRVTSGKTMRCRECYLKALRKGRQIYTKPRKPPRPTPLPQLYKSTYHSWKSMKARCSPANKAYFKNYAGRGISYCEAWESFETFLKDMGERPEGKTLDRKDNLLGYSPENCRWATASEQVSNTRVAKKLTVKGEVLTATQVARKLSLSITAICTKIKKDGKEKTESWVESRLQANSNVEFSR